jgi:hypothetical protein
MGTLRTEDLLDTFAWELLTRTRARGKVASSNPAYQALIDQADAIDCDADPDGAAELLGQLFEALEAVSPPFTYFGTHAGDAACFGYWISEDAIRDAIQDGELLYIGPRDDRPDRLPQGVVYVLVESDHGNLALYSRRGVEVW